jgi:hypothetical protein
VGDVRRWIKSRVGNRLLVHTTADDSIEGVLTLEARDGLVLEDADLLPAQGGRVELTGRVFIPRAHVRLIQEAPPKGRVINA